MDGRPKAVAYREPDTPRPSTAVSLWIVYVVLFSAVSALGPAAITFLRYRRWDSNEAFGEGELFPVAFAIFAAGISKWLTRRQRDGAEQTLSGLSFVFLILTSVLIAVVWANHKMQLGFGLDVIVVASSLVLAVSLVLGLITEVVYSLTAKS